MEWIYPRRRGPEWKQGWAGQTLASISTPPLHLLTIFGIVIVLLWLSQYTSYKAELQYKAANFQLLVFLFPVMLILFMISYSANWILYFRQRHYLQPDLIHHSAKGSSSPWGIALFLVLILVLLSYQSSFHSKWFGPLWRSV